MKLRSLLFVPGDSERKFVKAAGTDADGLILDLEDSVAPEKKPHARAFVASLLKAGEKRDFKFFVRINALDTGLALLDLDSVTLTGLDGIMVPKANGADDILRIGHYLDAFEQRAGLVHGTVKIIVVATEIPAAMFTLGSYVVPHPRLAALTWGAEDLSSAIGASTNKAVDGSWAFPYQLARAQCLFAASAASVSAIDTLFVDYRDQEGLAADCRASRRDGFTGRVAIHPDQVATINTCFSPSAEEIAHAQSIAAAFAANPAAGTIGIGGKMYDIPHLKAAQKILAAANPKQEASS